MPRPTREEDLKMEHTESLGQACGEPGLKHEHIGGTPELAEERTDSGSSDNQDSHDDEDDPALTLEGRPVKQDLGSPTSSPSQDYRQGNFLVAQLVDSHDATLDDYHRQAERAHDHAPANYHFASLVNPENNSDSLLAKLIQEQNYRHDPRPALDQRVDPAGQDPSRPDQPSDLQHRASQKSSSRNDDAKVRPGDLDDHVKLVDLFGIQIVALTINGKERLCLAQISNTLLKDFSYNEIHNRRVALGITCVQCTPIQLEMLRRAGAMPSSSRRCGMITMREAERLCRSFLAEEQPPELPENFYFTVAHRVNYGCKGRFVPARYISSRAKCIECFYCGDYYSPNKFIFHSHKQPDATDCNPPDSPNINSWRKHINLDWTQEHSQEIKYAWEDVKSLFNGGTRRRTSLAGIGFVSDQLATPTPPGAGAVRKPSEPATKASGRNSSGVRKQATSFDDETPIDVVMCDGRHAEAQRTLSQNERRKLPMGAWARDRQQVVAELGPGAPSLKRPASHFANPYEPMAQQQIKRLANQNGLQLQPPQQYPQHPPRPAPVSKAAPVHMPLLAEQQPPFYQPNYPFHAEPTGGVHRPASGRLAAGMGQAHQTNVNSIGARYEPQAVREPASACLHPSDPGQSGKSSGSTTSAISPNSCNNLGQEPALSMPTSFIYGQLYSQLMQSHLAQQISQRQQRLAPVDAQLALRQHIWSSLLANLRCNQGQHEQPACNLQEAKLAPGQLPAYCSANTLGQQQPTSSLLATAAIPVGSGSQPTASQQAIEAGDLTSLPPLAAAASSEAFGSLIPMRMYASNIAQATDMAAIFNGANEGGK